MNIYVSGSIAYDRIMDFPGYFSEHILPEKIHVLNVSFTVNGLTENYGGTAGNIAYALSLLGEKPVILGAIGQDHRNYFTWLEKHGITTDHIRVLADEFTAGAYITTDLADNQITGFNPGAMKHPSGFDFNSVKPEESLVIVSPGNLDDMINYSADCRDRNIPFIFDPGQSLPIWEADALLTALRGARVLISNDYELDLIINKTGQDKAALLGLCDAVLTTLGEKGALLATKDGEREVPVVKPARVVDPTGAGDAFRGGLLKGITGGHDVYRAALMGSVSASFAVENQGTQTYSFTPAQYQSRLETVL